MLRTWGLVVSGAIIGSLITMVLYPSSSVPDDRAALPAVVGDAPATVDIERCSCIERPQRVAEREQPVGPESSPTTDSVERRNRTFSGGLRYGQLVEQLVAGGFTEQRAEWIKSQYDALAIELASETVSITVLSSPESLAFDLNHRLRQELDDTEYERYRKATGQRTAVDVLRVAENSPAAFAGLMAGDSIVSYDGNRVFDAREIAPLSSKTKPYENVIVDLLRGDQPVQIVVVGGAIDAALYSGSAVLHPEHLTP